MIDWTWITTTGTTLLMILLSGIGIYIALIVFTRLMGLRSFSKMSSFDFAITISIGALVASTLLGPDPPLLAGVFGLAVLYGIQYAVSKSRRVTSAIEALVDNEPLLVMAGEEILSDHLDKARMTEDDLRSKLRSSGVSHPNQVLAVIFETTGDVSVIQRNDDVIPWIFEDVRGAEHLDHLVDMAPSEDLEHTSGDMS